MGKRPDDVITATEIATWVYCPEQWRLQYGLGLQPANRKELAAGTRHHSRKAAAERVAGMFIALGRLLLVLAVLAGLLLLVWDDDGYGVDRRRGGAGRAAGPGAHSRRAGDAASPGLGRRADAGTG